MWAAALAASTVIFLAYLAIFYLITIGLIRSGQLWTNRLGTATAAIFFSCGIGHGLHGVHLLEGMPPDLHLAIWDSTTALVALGYLTLRKSFGTLLGQPSLFDDLEVRQLQAELAEAQSIAQVGSWSMELGSGRVTRSPEFLRIFDLAEGEQAWDRVHPEDRARLEEATRLLREDGVPMDEVLRVVIPGREETVVRSRGRREVLPDGKARITGTSQDITESHRLQDELREAKASLEAVLRHSPTAIYLKDRDQRFLMANEETARAVGLPVEELVGRSLHDIYPADTVASLAAVDAEVFDAGVPVTREETAAAVGAPDEDRTWLSVRFPVRDRDDEIVAVGGVSLDITEHKRAEAAHRAAEERFRAAFQEAGVPMTIVSLDPEDLGRVVDANRAFADLLGRELDEIIGRRATDWLHPDDHGSAHTDPLQRLACGDEVRVQHEGRYLHQDGHVLWTIATEAAFRDEHGRLVAVGQTLDISERKHFEGQLQHLADHDALTGLYNRRRLDVELGKTLALANRYGGGGAVLALDLDGFKFVNDSLGHAAGDDLVTRLGATIRRTLRETDIVARTGGDEFAVVLPHATEADAVFVAEKLLSAIRRAGVVVHQNRHAQVTTSIGIALFTDAGATTTEDLLVEADIAMYDAKAAGKDGYAVFRRDDRARERIAERQDWLTRLRAAIAQERFVLHAQPVVPICATGVPRFELLLRLPDEHGDLIPPGAFLYNAERFGLIEEIDLWVMRQAVRLLATHHAAGSDLALSINVSARTMNGGKVAEKLAALLADHPFPRERLVVEITETAAIANMEHARELAREIRALGCRLALDDFGAGFATFYYLKHLDFDFVKIDGEFIKNLPRNQADQVVVRAVVEIARGLGAATIAEFVQDDATLDVLRELGVGHAQGYHTGRPGPLDTTLPALPAGRDTPARAA